MRLGWCAGDSENQYTRVTLSGRVSQRYPGRVTDRGEKLMANTQIHEFRRLLLPIDTVVDALIELDIKHSRWPAGAQLVEVVVIDGEDESARSVVLSMRVPGQAESTQRKYPLPVIAAAIVNYCLKMRVPMPRNSTKTIQILPEGIALQLENTLILDRRHAEPPASRVVTAADGSTQVDPQTKPSAAADTAAGSDVRAGPSAAGDTDAAVTEAQTPEAGN